MQEAWEQGVSPGVGLGPRPPHQATNTAPQLPSSRRPRPAALAGGPGSPALRGWAVSWCSWDGSAPVSCDRSVSAPPSLFQASRTTSGPCAHVSPPAPALYRCQHLGTFHGMHPRPQRLPVLPQAYGPCSWDPEGVRTPPGRGSAGLKARHHGGCLMSRHTDAGPSASSRPPSVFLSLTEGSQFLPKSLAERCLRPL